MPLRSAAMALMIVGGALVILDLATHSMTTHLFVTQRQTQELSEAAAAAAAAYHDPTARSNGADLAAARQRFEQASESVESGRRRSNSLRWWARTIGFSLVILGGVLWMGQKTVE